MGTARRTVHGSLILLLMILLTASAALAAENSFNGYPVVPVTLNGQQIPSPTPAINFHGTTLIPLRAFATALGLRVDWVASTGSVNLTGSATAGTEELLARIDRLERELQQARSRLTALEAALVRQVPVADIFEKVRQSVVGLIVKTKQGTYQRGTGVIAWVAADRSEAEIHTNWHVVENFQDITVVLNDGRVLPGRFWSMDGDLDYATVRIQGANLPAPVDWGSSQDVRVGDPVIIVGNPLGYRNSVSLGILSGRGRLLDNSGYEFLQTDAAINPGNSGGPLLDRQGRYIGLVTLKHVGNGVEGLGFAIPIEAIRTSIGINNRPEQARSYLGAILSESLAAGLGAKSDTGLTIEHLDPAGPLARAGLQVGDEITEIGGQRMYSLADARRIVDTVQPGTRVYIKFKRGSLPMEAPAVLGAVKMWEYRPVQFTAPSLDPWEGAF